MEKYLPIIQACPLFQGIDRTNLLKLLRCLQARQYYAARGSTIFSAGERVTQLGLILSGRINTVWNDFFGNRSIIDTMGEGQLFCDAFSSTPTQRLPLYIEAQSDSQILLIETRFIWQRCHHNCPCHQKLPENFIHILAKKYADLTGKVLHLAGRTTRHKLISYLAEQARCAENKGFLLPFTQQELADYLFIDRSGLSTELNKLKKEGWLTNQNGLFYLHRPGKSSPAPEPLPKQP